MWFVTIKGVVNIWNAMKIFKFIWFLKRFHIFMHSKSKLLFESMKDKKLELSPCFCIKHPVFISRIQPTYPSLWNPSIHYSTWSSIPLSGFTSKKIYSFSFHVLHGFVLLFKKVVLFGAFLLLGFQVLWDVFNCIFQYWVPFDFTFRGELFPLKPNICLVTFSYLLANIIGYKPILIKCAVWFVKLCCRWEQVELNQYPFYFRMVFSCLLCYPLFWMN